MKAVVEYGRVVGVFDKGAYRELQENECVLSLNGEVCAVAKIIFGKMSHSIDATLENTPEMEDFFRGITGGEYG